MAKKMLGLIVAAGVVVPVLAQQGGGREHLLNRECRREVVRLCGMNRAEIRSCLRERGEELSDTCKAQFAEGIARRDRIAQAPPANAQSIAYGRSPAQKIDLYLPQVTRPAAGFPLVVYVHGGGWRNGDRSMVQQKPDFFAIQGWAMASVGYRLLPEAPVEQQAEDIAAAIGKLLTDARSRGIDAARIVVMGHSAGAHLAALVATDPAYLKADLNRLAGVILLDGAGYDVARQIQDTPMLAEKIYIPAFGTDPARHARLSPMTHTAAPNAARWLILHVANRKDAKVQSNALAQALTAAGASARVELIEGENHMTINRELGDQTNAHTRRVAEFLTGF